MLAVAPEVLLRLLEAAPGRPSYKDMRAEDVSCVPVACPVVGVIAGKQRLVTDKIHQARAASILGRQIAATD